VFDVDVDWGVVFVVLLVVLLFGMVMVIWCEGGLVE